MTADETRDFLRKSLEDSRLSRGEKRAIHERLDESLSTHADAAIVRRVAFEITGEAMGGPDAEAALKWCEAVVRATIPKRDRAVQEVAFFSPGEECLRAIIRQIERARDAIDICVFTITDDRISSKLVEANTRGVRVRIITDDDKAHDRGSDVHRLIQRGIAARFDLTRAHMHHKFALFDGRTLLSGSYNWTRSAARQNEENIIITDSATLVRAFQAQFERLWERFG